MSDGLNYKRPRVWRAAPRADRDGRLQGARPSDRRGHCAECDRSRVLTSRGLCRSCFCRLRAEGRLPPKKSTHGRPAWLQGAVDAQIALYRARAARGLDIFTGERRGRRGGVQFP